MDPRPCRHATCLWCVLLSQQIRDLYGILFTNRGRTAVRLYGPGVDKLTAGISGVDLATVGTDVAAAASSSSPPNCATDHMRKSH